MDQARETDGITCCYYNLMHAAQAGAEGDGDGDGDSDAFGATPTVREYVVCLLLRCMPGDADLDLFRPELDRYCATRIRPHLAALDAIQRHGQDSADAAAGVQLPPALETHLQEWAPVCVEYLSAIVEASRACLDSLLLAALLGHSVTSARPATAQHCDFLLEALSLSKLLHIGSKPASPVPARKAAEGADTAAATAHTLVLDKERDALSLEP